LIFGGTLRPAYSPVFSEAPGSFSAMKQVKPLWRGWASGSVLTSTKTSDDVSPLVTHIFWPLIS
jgi:hypothetical protein